MLLNAAKCQGYSFYHFWVIKGKPTPHIRVKTCLWLPVKQKTKNRISEALSSWKDVEYGAHKDLF